LQEAVSLYTTPLPVGSVQPTMVALWSKAAEGAPYSLATPCNHHYLCEQRAMGWHQILHFTTRNARFLPARCPQCSLFARL